MMLAHVIRCPHCAHPLTAHDCLTDPAAVPDDGDVAICGYCRAASVFAATALGVLQLRPCTVAEERHVMWDPAITAGLDALAVAADPLDAMASARRALHPEPPDPESHTRPAVDPSAAG